MFFYTDKERFPFKYGKFNGKTQEEWEKQAKYELVTALIRASSSFDTRSIKGYHCAFELLSQAFQVDRFLVAEILELRGLWYKDITGLLGLLPDKKTQDEWRETKGQEYDFVNRIPKPKRKKKK